MNVGARRLLPATLDPNGYPVDRKSCSLLGPTALVVQGLMGILVVLSLVYKRHREAQRRPWKIWIFDVSKQVVGQAFVHFLNLIISGVGAGHSKSGRNACVFYFFNVLIDTTFGVAVIYGLLHLCNFILVSKLHLKGFASGQYGSPPRWSYWIRQALVYVAVLTAMKLLTIALFAVWPGIIHVGEWLLSWTGNGGSVQVIFVMGIFPIIMNVVQFWVIDTIVKGSAALPLGAGESSSPDTDDSRTPFIDGRESEEEEDGTRGEDLEAAGEGKRHQRTSVSPAIDPKVPPQTVSQG